MLTCNLDLLDLDVAVELRHGHQLADETQENGNLKNSPDPLVLKKVQSRIF
jgi:hypothetical protein